VILEVEFVRFEHAQMIAFEVVVGRRRGSVVCEEVCDDSLELMFLICVSFQTGPTKMRRPRKFRDDTLCAFENLTVGGMNKIKLMRMNV